MPGQSSQQLLEILMSLGGGGGGGMPPSPAPQPGGPMSDGPNIPLAQKWRFEEMNNAGPLERMRNMKEQQTQKDWGNAPEWWKKMMAEQYWMKKLNGPGQGGGMRGGPSMYQG